MKKPENTGSNPSVMDDRAADGFAVLSLLANIAASIVCCINH